MSDAILSAEEYQRRVMASIFGTPKGEVEPLLVHDEALRADRDRLAAENARLREALAESQDIIRRMAFGGTVVGYEIRERLDLNAAALSDEEAPHRIQRTPLEREWEEVK